jgi:hypothetical protein
VSPSIVLFLMQARIWGDGLMLHYRWMWMGKVLVGLSATDIFLAVRQTSEEP